ncbi:cyclin-domain-containing protein [Geopyxis carbonaria]|nr:cyclin-domain-containing protein [Geopyxis carbonaria]
MITHPESAVYRPPLTHSATNPDHQWSRVSSSTVPAPREPATSARGAPSVFRHHSTGSHTSSSSSTLPHTPSNPIPFESSTPSITHKPSGSLGTASASSTSSSLAASEPQQSSPSRAKRTSEDTPPIRLRNLSHVVELSKDDYAHSQTPPRRNRSGYEDKRRYEISSMPVGDVIEMVAGLLTKITTTNDRQHDHTSRNIPPEAAMGLGGTTNSVLAFHGKNVPSITIMSYLSRIHKYCPTTYEVFLSLLVYFDRMTERSYGPLGSHVFVVDSFNIHRLVIAGVTCASKFFSDVFYTNSRYAKVGGLPLAELNHLELQFLILNDFRLSVPVEELEAYGTMLVQFYAREAIANANLQGPSIPPPPPPPITATTTTAATSAAAVAANVH